MSRVSVIGMDVIRRAAGYATAGRARWKMIPLLRTRTVQTVLLLVAVTFLPVAPAMSTNVFGLVIGIDKYEHLRPLRGAVNDARDVSDALESMAARDVRLLLNGDATREEIFRHWAELIRIAEAGDILIFHFAGHGGRQSAILQDGHEAKDNMFLLAGYENEGEGVVQRIVDNEIGHLLAMETEATVVFVADSCFAGGMVRSVGVPVSLRYDPTADPTIRNDAVTQRVRALGEVNESDLEHVIWIYGQDDNKSIQEIVVDGQSRGALSHIFSRAIRGAADANGDARLSVPELKRFVNKEVPKLTERRQRPHVNAGSFDLSIGPITRPPERPSNSEAPVPLRIFFSDDRPPFELAGITEVKESQLADIVYSAKGRKLIYKTGDIVAEFDPGESAQELFLKLQGAVDKWRLLELLAVLGSSDDPKIELSGGSRVYLEGEMAKFQISSGVDRTAIIFNLAHDGTVQILTRDRAGNRLRAGEVLIFKARVREPFGADHLVAITTEDDPAELFDTVFASDGRRHGALLAQALAEILKGGGFGVDRAGLFTQARGDGE